MIVNGDTSQIDLPKGTTSGLIHAQRRRCEAIPKIAFAHFEAGDVVRHPVVADIICVPMRNPIVKNNVDCRTGGVK